MAGDTTDAGCVASVAADAVALVNAVTPFTAPPESFDGFDADHYVRLVANLARAARASGARRVVEIGLAATLRTAGGRVHEDAAAFPVFLRPFAEARVRGLAAWRDHSGDVDWVVLTPPPVLAADAPSHGGYRLGPDKLDSARASAPLSYDDLAIAVLDQIDSPTAHREQTAVHAATAPTEPRGAGTRP